MKSLILLIIISNITLAQNNVIADSVKRLIETATIGLYYNPVVGKLVLMTKNNPQSGYVDLSSYFASTQEVNSIKTQLNNLENSVLTKNRFELPVTLQPTIFLLTYDINEADASVTEIDAMLSQYSQLYKTLNQRIKALEDTISWMKDTIKAHSDKIWTMLSPPSGDPPYPRFIKYKDTVNAFVNISSVPAYDTIVFRNTGNATLKIFSYSWTKVLPATDVINNPFVITQSIDSIQSDNASTLQIRFLPLAANTYYKYKLVITHNGSLNQEVKTDSIWVSGSYVPPTVPSEEADIYVDATSGNDNNNGAKTSPVKSIAKALELIQPTLNERRGYIALKAGEVFKESVVITSDSITITSYGTGAKPIITLREELPGWNVPSNWTQYTTNVWQMPIQPANNKSIWRLWINGNEAELEANRSEVDSVNEFCHYAWQGIMYIYATTNPATAFTSIEYSGGIAGNGKPTRYGTIILKDCDYIVLDNLDIRGGLYTTIQFAGSSYDTIKNCVIGKDAQMYGIRAGKYFINTTRESKYNVILNNVIDSDWANSYTTEANAANGGDATYGIALEDNTAHWDIYANYIANWWFHFQVLSISGLSQYHKIHDNEQTNDKYITMGYPITLYALEAMDNGRQYVRYYNNYVYNITTFVECFSSNNFFYYNIFKDFKQGTASYQSNNQGYGFNIYYNDGTIRVDSNFIFNNTFDSTLRANVLTYSSTHQFFYNNLFLDGGYRSEFDYPLELSYWERDVLYNNLIYTTGSNNNTKLIKLFEGGSTRGTYTVAELNNGLAYRKTASGNIYPTGLTKIEIMTPDFALPISSPALEAGIDVRHLITTEAIDRWGNTIDDTPNIGAWNGTP